MRQAVISMNSPSILSSSSFISNSTLNPPPKSPQFFKPLIQSSPIRCSNDKSPNPSSEDRADEAGVKFALSMLNFYKSGSGFDPPRWFDEESPPDV